MSGTYLLVADGACSGNPGPGGWGLIVVTPEGSVREFGGAEANTTNNRMELFGFYRGLQEIHRRASEPGGAGSSQIRVISDSKYVLEGAERSLAVWPKRNWKTVAGEPVKNQDLWERISKGKALLEEMGFHFIFELVKGHSGSEANERCDQIAVRFSKGEPVRLFEGPREKYAISLEASVKFEPVYLSLVAGVLHRDATWDACKARVEGKSAKYKKVKNRLEEQETLQAWGIKG